MHSIQIRDRKQLRICKSLCRKTMSPLLTLGMQGYRVQGRGQGLSDRRRERKPPLCIIPGREHTTRAFWTHGPHVKIIGLLMEAVF
eukprot:12408821-Karenia_brevis.AAC.1